MNATDAVGVVQATWPSWPINVSAYLEGLRGVAPGAVVAATSSLAADGLKEPPSVAQIRQRVAQLIVDAPSWTVARATLITWRDGCRKHSAERASVERGWQCPFDDGNGTGCDGTGFVWVDDSTTTDCRCKPQLVAAIRGASVLPPLLRRFLDEKHASPFEIDALATGDTSLEAQIRVRWQEFVGRMVSDEAVADTAAGTLPGLEAARARAAGERERRGLRVMDPIAAAGLLPRAVGQ